MARRLDHDEKALWGLVIKTVKPIHRPRVAAALTPPADPPKVLKPPPGKFRPGPKPPPPATPVQKTPVPALAAKGQSPQHNLDGHWDRRLTGGTVIPDISVDLHGTGLTGAYNRLDGALEQAVMQKMRVILLVTGKIRSHDRQSGEGRGAIASVVRDWLAASRHASSIAAVRSAHPRHGGTGALYIILKR